MNGVGQGMSAEDLVDQTIGARIELAGEPPGVRHATEDGVAKRLDAITERMRVQFEHLRVGSSRHIPDAYFADEQEAETELQEVAAGVRAAMATIGVYGDAREVEIALAEGLGPTSLWARLSEGSRVPRPSTRPEVFAWTRSPVPWTRTGGEWPPPEARSLVGLRQITDDEPSLVTVTEAPYAGWAQLGFIEQQTTPATRRPDAPLRQLMLMAGLEVLDDTPPPNTAPLSRTSPASWTSPIRELMDDADPAYARIRTAVARGPLAALATYNQVSGAPAHDSGAGHHRFCVTPRTDLIASLGLHPARPAVRHLLVDENGPAMVCRQWRSYMVPVEDYGPLVHAVLGADLIVRPDLTEEICALVGAERLRLGISMHLREGRGPAGEQRVQ